jgi:S1-C subfamily serine protease
VGEFLYGTNHHSDSLDPDYIYQSLPEMTKNVIDRILDAFYRQELVHVPLQRNEIRLGQKGKWAFETDCLAELILGRPYIRQKYSTAVVHIVVQDRKHSDQGNGTGFFVAEPANYILTARHVLEDKAIRQIDRGDGDIVKGWDSKPVLGNPDLDLALIPCPVPGEVHPLRVAWNEGAIQPSDPVLLVAYPTIPGHHAAPYFSDGQVNSIPPTYGRRRVSLVISTNTPGGCSGGPVLNHVGLVVGVIREEGRSEYLHDGKDHSENQGNEETGAASSQREVNVVFATPTFYLREIRA